MPALYHRTAWIFWCLAGLLAVSSFVCTLAQQQAADTPVPRRVLVNTYCLSCHNDSLKTAGLALDTISVESLVSDQQKTQFSGQVPWALGRMFTDALEDESTLYEGGSSRKKP